MRKPQRPAKPPSTDHKARREQSGCGGAKPGHEGHNRVVAENSDTGRRSPPNRVPGLRAGDVDRPVGRDPRVAMAVARSEGFGRFDGDHGTSFGDFQMQIGGGLGDLYCRTTGKDPRDPKNELELDRFALDQAKRGGWGPWHGAARIGVHGHYGFGHAPVDHPELKPSRRAPAEHEGVGGSGSTARLEQKLDRVAAEVERGGLHRVELIMPKGVEAKKRYSRGSVGMTTA